MNYGFENASSRGKRLSLDAEVFMGTADELAEQLVFGNGSDGGFLKENILQSEPFRAAYTEALESLSFGGELPLGVPKETAGFLSGFRSKTECFIASYLLSAICRKKAEAGEKIDIGDFLSDGEEPKSSKIAYMRNSYSDKAYAIFSEGLKDATVLYPPSFAAVCEEVYYGRAGFCILPFESSEEGALSGFRRMISKYELHPVLTCSVITDVSLQSTTRFALLAKSSVRLDARKMFRDRALGEYLRITVGGSRSGVTEEVLMSASLNGLTCVKAESVPLPWDGARYSSVLTFSLDGGDPVPFLLYLLLNVPEGELDGAYTDVGV